MNDLSPVLNNRAIGLPVLAWLIAQVSKFVVHLVLHRDIDFRKLVSTGGMPSSHSAITVCLATILGMDYGFGSGVFALAVIFALVVMTDAAGVRRAAGKQAEVLNKLIHHSPVIRLDQELKELLGHTPVQVFAGAVLGIAVALLLH